MSYRATFDSAVNRAATVNKDHRAWVRLLHEGVKLLNGGTEFTAEIRGYDNLDGFCVRMASIDGVYAGNIYITLSEIGRIHKNTGSRAAPMAGALVNCFAAQEGAARFAGEIRKETAACAAPTARNG